MRWTSQASAYDLVVPWVATDAAVEPGAVHVAAVVLAEEPPVLPEVALVGGRLQVRWPDGSRDEVDLR